MGKKWLEQFMKQYVIKAENENPSAAYKSSAIILWGSEYFHVD